MLIGKILDKTNPDIVQAVANGSMTAETAAISYNYTWPLVMLACLGIVALLLGFVLKSVDKKKNIGLELPNILPEDQK